MWLSEAGTFWKVGAAVIIAAQAQVCASRAILEKSDPDEMDDTFILGRFIHGMEDTLIIPARPGGWITDPLTMVYGNKVIIFLPGAELRARPGAFDNAHACLLTLRGVDNVIVIGYGARMVMSKNEYRPGEWRHAISILGCQKVSISGLGIDSSGGDGIYLGALDAKDRNRNSDVVIRDCALSGHRRQGISVISAERVDISRTLIEGTSGTPPACGIDFEPNEAYERLVDCVVRECIFSGNDNAGVSVWTAHLGPESIPVSISLRNCLFAPNRRGPGFLFLGSRKSGARGSVRVVSSRFEAISYPAILVYDKPKRDLGLEFDSLEIAHSPGSEPGKAPGKGAAIVIAHSESKDRLGGMRFHAVDLSQSPASSPFAAELKGTSSIADIYLNARIKDSNALPSLPKGVIWSRSNINSRVGVRTPMAGRYRPDSSGGVAFAPFRPVLGTSWRKKSQGNSEVWKPLDKAGFNMKPGNCIELRTEPPERDEKLESVCLPVISVRPMSASGAVAR